MNSSIEAVFFRLDFSSNKSNLFRPKGLPNDDCNYHLGL